jgi:excinuclease UvrABC nuclease subunit
VTVPRRRRLTEKNIALLPDAAGVYVLFGTEGAARYVGRAASLRARLRAHLRTGDVHAPWFGVLLTKNEGEASRIERELVEELAPQDNVAPRL